MQGKRMFNYPCILQCLYILVGYYDFKELIVLVKGRLQIAVYGGTRTSP